LAVKGYESAMISKRKTIKDTDLLHVIHSHGAFDWLRDDFPQNKAPAPSRSTKPATLVSTAPETARITNYFTRE
jgi:hypothetical protein